MAITVNDPYAHGAGGPAAQQFSNTFNTGLQNLFTTKMQNVQKKQDFLKEQAGIDRNAKLYETLTGGNKNVAQLLARDKNLAKTFAQDPVSFMQALQQISQVSGEEPSAQQGLMPEQAAALQGQPNQAISEPPMQGQVMGEFSRLPQKKAADLPGAAQEAQQPGQQAAQQAPLQRSDVLQPDIAETLSRKPIGKMGIEAYERARKEQNRIDDALKPLNEGLRKTNDKAKRDYHEAERALELVNEGKLTPADQVRFAKNLTKNAKIIGGALGGVIGGGLGLLGGIVSPIPGGAAAGATVGAGIGSGLGTAAGAGLVPEWVGTEADQKFNKVIKGFMTRPPESLGSSAAAETINNFLETLPNLTMDDGAKKEILVKMLAVNNLDMQRYEMANAIRKENFGYDPINKDEILNKRMASYEKQVWDDVAKTVKQIEENNGKMPQEKGAGSRFLTGLTLGAL